jgi:hypothetical protein
MARTIDEIFNSIMAEKANKADLDTVNSVSRVAMFRMWAYITAVCIWVHEKYWDVFRAEIETKIEEQVLGKARWYRAKALAFQYGQELDADTGEYDNSLLTDDQIAALKIIKYAAVPDEDSSKPRIKVAKQAGGLPVQLSEDELAAFKVYMSRIKFTGVKLVIDSLPPDSLKLVLDIWYNPLVLKSDGSRIDGAAAAPVKDGIKTYLNLLPFNGEYATTRLTNYLEKIDGVELPVVKLAQSKYGLFAFTGIDEKSIPDAGYYTIANEDLTINYREYVQS